MVGGIQEQGGEVSCPGLPSWGREGHQSPRSLCAWPPWGHGREAAHGSMVPHAVPPARQRASLPLWGPCLLGSPAHRPLPVSTERAPSVPPSPFPAIWAGCDVSLCSAGMIIRGPQDFRGALGLRRRLLCSLLYFGFLLTVHFKEEIH